MMEIENSNYNIELILLGWVNKLADRNIFSCHSSLFQNLAVADDDDDDCAFYGIS